MVKKVRKDTEIKQNQWKHTCNIEKVLSKGLIAVSYTHLDVYKRQVEY